MYTMYNVIYIVHICAIIYRLQIFLDFPFARISELIFGASLPEKSIINIKVIEKTGRRNLPILQEEETFRIFGIYR